MTERSRSAGAARAALFHSSPRITIRSMYVRLALGLLATPAPGVCQAITVYRCPGPPAIYTDQISEAEAQGRGCRSIEGAPITFTRPKARDRSSSQTPESKSAGPITTSGSAVLVSATGHLLTNYHVVEGCSGLIATRHSDPGIVANVIAVDRRQDLALVATKARTESFAHFRRSPLRAGDQVIALGFPYRGLLASEVNVSTGTVSALAGLANDPSKVQLQAPVQPGSSGGPVLDSDGALAGIVVAKLNALKVARLTGDIPQNINFAIKGEVAAAFMRSAGVTPVVASVRSVAISLADMVADSKSWVYLLECTHYRSESGKK